MSLCGNFENNIAVLVQGGNFHFRVHGRSHIKGSGVAKIDPDACFLQNEETLGPISLLPVKDEDRDKDKDKDKGKPEACFLQNKQTLGPISLLPFKSPF